MAEKQAEVPVRWWQRETGGEWRSGIKYTAEPGFTAIKDGMKQRNGRVDAGATQAPKAPWLRAKAPSGTGYQQLLSIVDGLNLATVCEESHCPNIGECWGVGTATLMLMGSVCTRACRFCAVDTGNPRGTLDREEPARVAAAVAAMGLRYVVLTSVDRDDLDDHGAAHLADCISAIKAHCPGVAVEILAPDFGGDAARLARLMGSGPLVFAHNLETVERLTPSVRDARCGYRQSLSVLSRAKQLDEQVLTKSSLMVGLGETEVELLHSMEDLRASGVDLLTIGQYLQPSPHHHPVHAYVPLEAFERYRRLGVSMGFREVVSGPLVRSSYKAEQALEKAQVNRGGAVPVGQTDSPASTHSRP